MGRTYKKQRTTNKVRKSRRAERATIDCERELTVEERAEVEAWLHGDGLNSDEVLQ